MMFGFNPTKCKTQCRLGVGRIKLLRNKKQIAMKTHRKEVAELLRQGKQGNARIRVEAVMREHHMLHGYEILELYLELLAVRAELLGKTKEIPPDMVEAICSLIYAGERVSTDLNEVAVVAKMLISKYGSMYKSSGFPEEVVSDLTCRKWQVNDTLVECLAVTAPLPETKLQFLEEIAAEYGVEFDKDAAALDMLPAAGKPLAVQAYAVAADPLAPGGAGVPKNPPLAQGWMPPAGPPPPPPPSATQPAGWRPPGAGPAAAGGAAGGEAAGGPAATAAAAHYQRMLSGASVVVRNVGAAPAPSGNSVDSSAWSPPPPEDMNRHGRAFQSHIGAAKAWRQVKLHGVSPPASPDTSQAGGQQFAQPAAAAAAAAAAVDVPPPAVAAPDYGSVPSTGISSGSSTPPVGDKPFTPGSSYADASAAADAAKHYSELAHRAAQRAGEFAAGRRAASEAQNGEQAGQGEDAASSSGSGDGGGGGGDGGGNVGGPSYVPRSRDEVQAAYDAAPGPPPKGAVGPPVPPSPLPTDEGPDEGEGSPDLDLPSVPGAPPPPPGAQDELDELTKRFEMLKRR
ncbi:hypothetical protein D9Q98_002082 [Chlorella vulgaris]|uniref:IST1-like protein n=1 Tax=Chlorella vulgaris TaxID=3077 RepID=A0A9D4TW57_CHLVU|nr:hypothetical protein D9Q98_002082 [Chlorella vulgaris]